MTALEDLRLFPPTRAGIENVNTPQLALEFDRPSRRETREDDTLPAFGRGEAPTPRKDPECTR